MTAACADPWHGDAHLPECAPRLTWYHMVILLIVGIAGAYVGSHAVSGFYYLLVEKIAAVHSWWHQLVPDKPLRNDFRDVAEGLIGGYVGQAIAWNHLKWKGGSVLGKLDDYLPWLARALKWTRKRPFLEIATSVVVSIPFAVPGFIAAYYILAALHGHATGVFTVIHSHTSPGLWARAVNEVPANWPQKIMGLSASFFFGRRAMKRAYDDTQLWFAERAYNKRDKPWWLPNFRMRVAEVSHEYKLHTSTSKRHGGVQTATMLLAVLVFILLAVYGWLVLTYIANGQPIPIGWLN